MLALRFLAKAVFLPPCSQILCFIVAWILWRRAHRLAYFFLASGLITLYLFSTPLFEKPIVHWCERVEVLPSERLNTIKADAIVILTGGQFYAPEFGGFASNLYGLLRLRYGAFLHRETGLPVLVSGGVMREDQNQALADTMAADFQRAFGLDVTWRETRSRTTAENAQFSYELLHTKGITRILLVTDAMHMHRAMRLFEHAGFSVTPAPTGFRGPSATRLRDVIPTAESLYRTSYAIHELMGSAFYSLTTMR